MRAGEILAEELLLTLTVAGHDQHQARGHLGRGLHRLAQPADALLVDHQPVHHDLEVVLLVLVERDPLGQLIEVAVDAGPDEA